MIKLTYLIKKRQDLSDGAFATFWRETHARLVEEFADTLDIKRYAMNRRIDTVCNACVSKARELASSNYDGVIEFWWASIEDYQAGAGSPDGLKAIDAIVDAERRFIDFSKSTSFFTDEEMIFDRVATAKSAPAKRVAGNSKVSLLNETTSEALIK